MPLKLSLKYYAKINRMKRIPQKINDTMIYYNQYLALRTIKNFHDGIKKMSFGLERLKDNTIKRKMREGMAIPDAPLYGKGDEKKDNSYVNMLRLKKIDIQGRNGYKVFPSVKKHWKANLPLNVLLRVHELGTIINNHGKLIRIPARPALEMAYEKTLTERKKLEPSRMVKKAILDYINKAEWENIEAQGKRYADSLKEFLRYE
jgi:hypothetical protein